MLSSIHFRDRPHGLPSPVQGYPWWCPGRPPTARRDPRRESVLGLRVLVVRANGLAGKKRQTH
jgi:hypothetical protein